VPILIITYQPILIIATLVAMASSRVKHQRLLHTILPFDFTTLLIEMISPVKEIMTVTIWDASQGLGEVSRSLGESSRVIGEYSQNLRENSPDFGADSRDLGEDSPRLGAGSRDLREDSPRLRYRYLSLFYLFRRSCILSQKIENQYILSY
jgi:hypothetical protein